VGALIAAAAITVGLSVSGGSSGPSLNVAAAAYAATSPGTGIIEAVFVERFYQRSHVRVTMRHREWIDAVTGRRREQRSLKNGRLEELASAPGRIEQWISLDAREADVVRRLLTGARSGSPSFGSLPTQDTGIALYRRLYQQGRMRLIGRERHGGQLLWKLETPPIAVAYLRTNSRPVPLAGLVVLVDPNTFLPVIERQIDLQLPGHPIQKESSLVGYRHLPNSAASEALLDLAALHPSARVITTTPPGPNLLHAGRKTTR